MPPHHRTHRTISVLALLVTALCLGMLRALIAGEFATEALRTAGILFTLLFTPVWVIFLVVYYRILGYPFVIGPLLAGPRKLSLLAAAALFLYSAPRDVLALDALGIGITAVFAVVLGALCALIMSWYVRRQIPDHPPEDDG